jgi:hypothetical protein
MKVTVKSWKAMAAWRWDTGAPPAPGEDEDEEDVCGICRVPYEACCPACKMPGDDCPLSACRALVERERGADGARSLGRVHARLPHALSPQVDRDAELEAAVPDGPALVGCAVRLPTTAPRLTPPQSPPSARSLPNEWRLALLQYARCPPFVMLLPLTRAASAPRSRGPPRRGACRPTRTASSPSAASRKSRSTAGSTARAVSCAYSPRRTVPHTFSTDQSIRAHPCIHPSASLPCQYKARAPAPARPPRAARTAPSRRPRRGAPRARTDPRGTAQAGPSTSRS